METRSRNLRLSSNLPSHSHGSNLKDMTLVQGPKGVRRGEFGSG